ncbi:CrcB protein [Scopulibacillus daqui]|uniref:Fluoride-specific ion channel FluC n=1 Tax=Scopulibacillus daqui TaxID=1469162 RepID=A0ABS2PZU9_9BACL|nr:fluoride efflux transporter CrcB [Scopulibacillus daqui]MBM7645575.1 CrcB protein [Scopulibacillus daqui]
MIYWYVGIGGIIGALLRYGVSLAFNSFWSGVFPMATLTTNLLGSCVLGWLTSYLSKNKRLSKELYTGLGTGIIGSFTTFSTFSVETVKLMENAHLGLAFLYVMVSLFGGLLLSYAGYRAGEKMLQRTGGAS